MLSFILHACFIGCAFGIKRVFLMGGQSNMLGYATSSKLTTPYNAPQTDVKFWKNARFKHLTTGFGRSTDFGPEVSFGRAIKNALQGDDIHLVKYAVGGTNLYNMWKPTSGSVYKQFMRVANAALKSLGTNGVDYEISGMLWLQGESDAAANKGAFYKANLEKFIGAMRTQFDTPDMLFIIARVRDYYGLPAQSTLVRDAQVAIADSDANVEWFDTDTFNPLKEGGHYTWEAQIEIGKAFAVTYLNRQNVAAQDCVDTLADKSTCNLVGQQLWEVSTPKAGNGAACQFRSTRCVAGDGSIPANQDCVDTLAERSTCTTVGEELWSVSKQQVGNGAACQFRSTRCVAGDGSIPGNGNRLKKVFILAGQSNMLGYGISTELTAPYNAAQTDVKYWKNTKYVSLTTGFGVATDFGPEVSFGRAIKDALPTDDIHLVKYAVGGSNLYNMWKPTSGSIYNFFITKVTAALNKLGTKGVDYEISGMLWLQGESDAFAKQGAIYAANLRNFIADIRTTFKTPDLLFIIARVRDYYGLAAQSTLVRNAQVAIAESDANVEWFDTDTFNPLRKGGHYATDATLQVGKAFANTYLNNRQTGTGTPTQIQDQDCVDTLANRSTCTTVGEELWDVKIQGSMNGQACQFTSTLCVAGDGEISANQDCVDTLAERSTCTTVGQRLWVVSKQQAGSGAACLFNSTRCVAGDGSIPARDNGNANGQRNEVVIKLTIEFGRSLNPAQERTVKNAFCEIVEQESEAAAVCTIADAQVEDAHRLTATLDLPASEVKELLDPNFQAQLIQLLIDRQEVLAANGGNVINATDSVMIDVEGAVGEEVSDAGKTAVAGIVIGVLLLIS